MEAPSALLKSSVVSVVSDFVFVLVSKDWMRRRTGRFLSALIEMQLTFTSCVSGPHLMLQCHSALPVSLA